MRDQQGCFGMETRRALSVGFRRRRKGSSRVGIGQAVFSRRCQEIFDNPCILQKSAIYLSNTSTVSFALRRRLEFRTTCVVSTGGPCFCGRLPRRIILRNYRPDVKGKNRRCAQHVVFPVTSSRNLTGAAHRSSSSLPAACSFAVFWLRGPAI